MGEVRVSQLLLGLAAVGAVIAVVAIAGSMGWPVVHDAALMHYLGWRLWEGDLPWVDVIDVNLPATYLLHMGLHGAFEGSALAWRVLDLLMLALASLASFALVRPHGRSAGVLAAVAIVVLHLSRGAEAVGQRDFFVGTLELLASWAVLAWLERREGTAWRMGLAGVALGWCVATKPTAVAFLVVVWAVLGLAWRRGEVSGRELGMGLASLMTGFTVVVGSGFAWVAMAGVWDPFWTFWTTYMPLYRKTGGIPWWELLLRLRETPAAALLPLAPFHLWVVGQTDRSRALLLAGGVLAGAAHFIGQAKGYTYHLEPYAFFLVPAGLLGIQRAWEGVPWRTIGPATGLAAAITLGISGWWALSDDGIDEVQLAAAHSVGEIVGDDETVAVLDLAQGGVQGLFYARKKQHSRYIYDFYFYHDLAEEPVRSARKAFYAELDADPPTWILLFENSWPARTYERVTTFRLLERILRKDYVLVSEQHGFRAYQHEDAVEPANEAP